MARDYAQRRPAAARQVKQKGALPAWAWALAGLSIGLAVAAVVFISRPAPNHLAAEQPAKPAPKKKVELPPETPSRFSFYEMLPSYEVVIPGEPKPAKNGQTPPPIAQPGEYILQVGSFRARSDAEAQKAKLALLGIESRVEQVTIDNKDTWFRVRIGPEKDQARVNQLVARLQENGVQSFLMRVRK